jgi:hypothetical protein
MKTAIRPDFFINVPALAKAQSVESATDDEKSLYALSKTSGWALFKQIAEQTILELNNVNKVAISQGLPLEEIGRNAIVVSLAQEAIERLLNRVLDASEAIEKAE